MRWFILAAPLCVRVLPSHFHEQRIRGASNKTGKRSAERRIFQPCPHRQTSLRNSSVRGCVPCGTPPFGAHACGTRHRLLPRWLSSRTGFPAAAAKRAFLPLRRHKVPRLSTLRADRSLCRSTGDPKPPGSGLAKISARGDRTSPSLLRHAVRNGALHKAR